MDKKFEWSDELVREYVNKIISPLEQIGRGLFSTIGGGSGDPIEKFKASKQSVREWEIVGYTIDYLGVNNEIFTKQITGVFKTSKLQKYDVLTEEVLVHNKANIHSVKRISDGEVFTIGDYCNGDYIDGFSIGVNNNGDCDNNQIYVTSKNNKWGLPLNKLQKVKEPVPLFTDVLRKNVFHGDKFYTVTDDFKIVYSDAVKGIHLTPQIISRSYSIYTDAEEYILMNKPCLSLNEVMGKFIPHEFVGQHYGIFKHNELKELVKSKL